MQVKVEIKVPNNFHDFRLYKKNYLIRQNSEICKTVTLVSFFLYKKAFNNKVFQNLYYTNRTSHQMTFQKILKFSSSSKNKNDTDLEFNKELNLKSFYFYMNKKFYEVIIAYTERSIISVHLSVFVPL